MAESFVRKFATLQLSPCATIHLSVLFGSSRNSIELCCISVRFVVLQSRLAGGERKIPAVAFLWPLNVFIRK